MFDFHYGSHWQTAYFLNQPLVVIWEIASPIKCCNFPNENKGLVSKKAHT